MSKTLIERLRFAYNTSHGAPSILEEAAAELSRLQSKLDSLRIANRSYDMRLVHERKRAERAESELAEEKAAKAQTLGIALFNKREAETHHARAETAESLVASLRAQLRWIPVSEGYPHWGTVVLGNWNGHVDSTRYESGEWRDPDDDEHHYGEPTHWMTMPPPPGQDTPSRPKQEPDEQQIEAAIDRALLGKQQERVDD